MVITLRVGGFDRGQRLNVLFNFLGGHHKPSQQNSCDLASELILKECAQIFNKKKNIYIYIKEIGCIYKHIYNTRFHTIYLTFFNTTTIQLIKRKLYKKTLSKGGAAKKSIFIHKEGIREGRGRGGTTLNSFMWIQ